MSGRLVTPRRAALAIAATVMLGLQAARLVPPDRVQTTDAEALLISVAAIAVLGVIWWASPPVATESDDGRY